MANRKGFTVIEVIISTIILSSITFIYMKTVSSPIQDMKDKLNIQTAILKIHNNIMTSLLPISINIGETKPINDIFTNMKTNNVNLTIKKKSSLCYLVTGSLSSQKLQLNTCFPNNFKEI